MPASPTGDNKPTNMWEELNKPREDKDQLAAASAEQARDDDKAGTPLAGIIGGAVAIAAVAFAGFILMGGDADVVDPQAAAQGDPLALDDGSAEDQDATDAAESGDDADVDADTDVPADNTATEPTDDVYSPAVPAGAEDNYSVLSGGKLYLRGEIPSPLIEIGAVSALEEIMGEGNVISEYVINPDAPFEMGRPSDVFIEDTLLFELGSAEIAPDFYPLLGLGNILLNVQDGVTIEIYGHTDSVGSEASNLTLSQARVDAVEAFWVAQGADPERITAVGLGESEPVADNETPEGRQLNRRVEIIVTGFVFSL